MGKYYIFQEINEFAPKIYTNSGWRHRKGPYTVEPLLTDPPRSGLPLNNGHISKNGMISHRASVFLTSEKWLLQITDKESVPNQ